MAGTKIGGIKARKANLERYGKDFYRNIGRKGGLKTGVIKGFAANPELARKAGAIGGRKSRRRPSKDDIDRAEEVLEEESGRNK